MRRIGFLVLCAAGVAHGENPRDVFGLHPPPAAPATDCSDGTAFGCAQATDPLADADPLALATWLPGSYLMSLPVADATHDQVAGYALGAGADEAGPTFGGATGLENRWSIEGAPSDSLRTGASETAVPLAFVDGLLVTAGGFSARDRASTGGTIDARLVRGTASHEVRAYVWAAWGAPSRRREIASDSYQVRRGLVSPHARTSAAIVATGPLGPLLGGHAWYAAGIAPSLSSTDFTWHAARLVDRDGDGKIDGFPGYVELEAIETTTRSPLAWRIPAMARAGFDRGAHHLDLTLLGSANTDASYLYNSTIQAAGIDQRTLVGDAIATWRGTWHETRAHVQLAWHRAMRTQSAADPAAAGIPQLLSAYVPDMLPEDPVLAAACSDGPGDPYPMIPNCPVPLGYFASGGAGALVDSTADRPSLAAEVAHRLGGHVVRAGATGEDSRLVTTTRFTGNEQIRSLFPGEISARQFIAPGYACGLDPASPCPTVDHSTLTYRTRYTAAYLEDTWQAARDVRVDGGLRWELMWVGSAVHFSDELAPRLGASWDPLGGGRSRVWASMGRTYGILPAGLGATLIGTNRTVDNLSSPFGPGRFLVTGAPDAVAGGIEPLAQDEVVAGADAALASAVRARVWVQGRRLVRGLETTPDGFDNPGRPGTGGLPATRATELVAAELETAPTSRLALRVGYVYGRTVGSWAGPYDPREGAALYASSDFDASTANMIGPLPSELGHHLYIEAEGHGRIGSLALAVSTRLTLASGRPRDALGDADDGIIYLIPRGSAGYDAMLSQANLRLAASWRGFEATLDLIDAFDRRDATIIDPVYAQGALQPIHGGSYEDLVFLRDDYGNVVSRRPTYGLATAFQTPFSAVLGVHRAF